MPTGAGKTRTAMNVIAEQFRKFPGKSIIWLAHNEELCEQAASEFSRAWERLGSHSITIKRFWANRNLDPAMLRGDFIVAGLPKIVAAMRNNQSFVGELGSKTSLVVMDEAHQAIAPLYKLVLDSLVVPFQESSLLGLSATPGRTWSNIDADEQLANFFCKRKVTLKVEGYNNPVEYLINSGYLALPKSRLLTYNPQLQISQNERERIEFELDIPSSILERLAEDEIRNITIVNEILKLATYHKRILVFATNVNHSDLLAYILRSKGLWARSVTGNTLVSERQNILEEYKNNSEQTKIICNYGVLTTGFDAPRTSAAVIARPTTSLVLYSQMVGRATRGIKAGGNKTAEIVTVIDQNLPGFRDISEAFFNWEEVWE